MSPPPSSTDATNAPFSEPGEREPDRAQTTAFLGLAFYLWVGTLRLFTRFIQHALLKEFYHAPAVFQCWRRTLDLLDEASEPWSKGAQGPEDWATLTYFRERLCLARRAIDEGTLKILTPVDAIYAAQHQVTLCRYALEY